MLCARTLQLVGTGVSGFASAATTAQLNVALGTPMRAAPAVSLLSGATVSLTTSGDATFTGSGSVASLIGTATPHGALVGLTGFSGMTTFRPTGGATDFLLLSAEL
jgi:hypothetical protein